MKRKAVIIVGLIAIMAGLYACKKGFLTQNPKGVLDEETLASAKGVDKLLIASYAMLDGFDGGFWIGGELGVRRI